MTGVELLPQVQFAIHAIRVLKADHLVEARVGLPPLTSLQPLYDRNQDWAIDLDLGTRKSLLRQRNALEMNTAGSGTEKNAKLIITQQALHLAVAAIAAVVQVQMNRK